MTNHEWLERFQSQRLLVDPNALPLFIDSPPPLLKLPWFGLEYMSLRHVGRELHAGLRTVVAILAQEKLPMYRFACGGRYRYFTRREFMPYLLRNHGGELAKERRLRRIGRLSERSPLTGKCQFCGKEGKQWRHGRTALGYQKVRCGHCHRYYPRVPMPRPSLQATCKWCGATTRQWRHGYSGRNRLMKCGHCRRDYSLKCNPDYVAPTLASLGTPEERLAATRARLARGPSAEEIEQHTLRLLGDIRAREARLDAELAAHQAVLDREFAAVKSYQSAYEIALDMATRPPRPGEPPHFRDRDSAWDWLIEARDQIVEEHFGDHGLKAEATEITNPAEAG